VLASPRHWPRYGQFRRHAAGVRAALDTLEPIPSTTLLSAQEAKDRLGEIVEGFFFRRLRAGDARRVGRLLVKSPPGLGKTTQAIECAIRYQAEQEGKDGGPLIPWRLHEAGVPAQTSIFVSTAQLRARRRCDDDDADDSAERRRHFNPKQANILICDEDPTASLVEQGRLSAEDIPGSARMGSGDDPCGPSSPRRPTDLLARPRRLRGPAS
jgi:hypothetical protein